MINLIQKSGSFGFGETTRPGHSSLNLNDDLKQPIPVYDYQKSNEIL